MSHPAYIGKQSGACQNEIWKWSKVPKVYPFDRSVHKAKCHSQAWGNGHEVLNNPIYVIVLCDKMCG